MMETVYLGGDRFASIDPETEAIVIAGSGPRGGWTFSIPLANAEKLTSLVERAKVMRAAAML